jgi:uncharacterized membrane protein
MVNVQKTILTVIAAFIGVTVMAQEAAATASKDKEGFMRSEGKIYVVVAVLLTILVGLIIYVARLDRKISKLEKRS